MSECYDSKLSGIRISFSRLSSRPVVILTDKDAFPHCVSKPWYIILEPFLRME